VTRKSRWRVPERFENLEEAKAVEKVAEAGEAAAEVEAAGAEYLGLRPAPDHAYCVAAP
jgi:hypothetical protein